MYTYLSLRSTITRTKRLNKYKMDNASAGGS